MVKNGHVRDPGGDAAVGSSVVAFLVAGVLFMASVVAVLVTTRTSSDTEATGDAPNATAFRVRADSLAEIFLDSPGFVHDQPDTLADWSDGANAVGRVANADSLARLGLRDAQSQSPNMLDFAKFQNLRAAPYASSATDGFVNYEDARRGLGLEASGLNFHIRAYPSLRSVQDLLACASVSCKDPNLLLTYVGDIQPPSAATLPPASTLASQLGNPALSCAVSPDASSDPDNPFYKAYRISSTIVNTGTTATQIRGVFDIRFSDGPRYTRTVNSPIIGITDGVDDTFTFNLDVPAYNGRECGVGTDIDLDLYDSDDKLITVTTDATNGLTAAQAASGATASDKDLWLEASTYYVEGTSMKLTFDGSAAGNGFKSKPFFFALYEGEGQDGLLMDSLDVTSTSNGKGGDIVLTPASPLVAGTTYTAVLHDGSFADAASAKASGAMRVSARVNVVSSPPGPFTPPSGGGAGSTEYVPNDVVDSEVYMLESLVAKFCPTYHDSKVESPIAPASWTGPWTNTDEWTEAQWVARCAFKGPTPLLDQPGDVFPDSKNPLRDELVPRLICDIAAGCPTGPVGSPGYDPTGVPKDSPRYDITRVLIIGSNVDHNELAPAEIKYALEDWVKGGGTLIVLGSVDQSVNWLMPILKTGIKSSSGGVSVPDPAHPVLHVPDELDYPNYDHNDQVWDFRGSHDADELFTQVVSQGGVTDFEPILAVSNPGAIQDEATGTSGTVILTTWLPYDLFQGADDGRKLLEGQKFLNNLLMMGYGDLYLDYGPSIPQGTNVIPAVRFAQIMHPDFDEPVQLNVNVFVFN